MPYIPPPPPQWTPIPHKVMGIRGERPADLADNVTAALETLANHKIIDIKYVVMTGTFTYFAAFIQYQ